MEDGHLEDGAARGVGSGPLRDCRERDVMIQFLVGVEGLGGVADHGGVRLGGAIGEHGDSGSVLLHLSAWDLHLDARKRRPLYRSAFEHRHHHRSDSDDRVCVSRI